MFGHEGKVSPIRSLGIRADFFPFCGRATARRFLQFDFYIGHRIISIIVRTRGVIISFRKVDECIPGILATQLAPLLHNRLSQQLGQLSTPPGARPSRPDFFRFLTVPASLSVSPCFSSRRGFPSNSPRFLDMSLSTVCPVPSFHRHRLLLSPSLSVTFNSDPTIPPSPSLSLSSPCRNPVNLSISTNISFSPLLSSARHSLFLYLSPLFSHPLH